jgi:predicted amidohydrolase
MEPASRPESRFVVAAAQFAVFQPGDWSEVEQRLAAATAEAAQGRGAQLLVFPEYAAMTVAGLFPPAVRSDLALQIAQLQSWREHWLALHRSLAQEHRVHILAGSFPWQLGDGRYVNRAWFIAPSGAADYQDKLIMTRFEREQWNIAGGDQLKVFDTTLGRIGVNVCYDVEFPLLARRQAEAGATLILVPSCTDTCAGYWRVRLASQARALENQCLVVQAPLVGEAPWSPAVDVNVGAAAVYGPPDRGFPDDGVLVRGEMNAPGWICTEIDCARTEAVRRDGQVLNFHDWDRQASLPQSIAAIRSLS